jgi:anti-sigma B factor antagonist
MLEPTIIAPVGELDLTTVADFRAAIATAAREAGRMVLDLSRVEFIDSTGLAAVLDACNRYRRDAHDLALVVPNGSAPAVALSLSGLRHTLPIADTLTAALTL